MMGRTWVNTEEMERRRDGLTEKIEALKENFQEICIIYQKQLEQLDGEKRVNCEKWWEQKKASGEEIIDHLEYLNRMAEYAEKSYHLAEEQILSLVQELPD